MSGVTPAAFECIVRDTQVVKYRGGDRSSHHSQNPHNLVGLQEGTYDDDIGSKGKQHSSKLSGIQWDLMRAFLKLKAYEARVCAEEL